MALRFSNPDDVAPPMGSYSHLVSTPPGAGLVFLSGQVPVRPDGSTPDNLADQADQVYANIVAVLASNQIQPDAIVKLVTYLVEDDIDGVVPKARSKYLGDHKPASTIVYVRGLALPGWLIEVEAIAIDATRD